MPNSLDHFAEFFTKCAAIVLAGIMLMAIILSIFLNRRGILPGRKLFDAIWPLLLVLLMEVGWLVLLFKPYQSHWLKAVFIGLQLLVLAVVWRTVQHRMSPEHLAELQQRFPLFRIKPIWLASVAVGIVLVSGIIGYMAGG